MPPLPPLPPSTLLIHHITPPPPSFSQEQITAHYLPPTLTTIQSLTTPTLTIAVFAPFLSPGHSRSASCDRVQRILTALYSLVSTSLNSLGKIEGSPADGGDVDSRVVFYWDEGGAGGNEDEDEDAGEGEGALGKWGLGPVFGVRAILGPREGERWQNVVYVVGGVGWSRPSWVGEVGVSSKGVVVIESTPPREVEEEREGREDGYSEKERRHEIIIVGGTFDHLHSGHKLLLTTTAFLVDPPGLPRPPAPAPAPPPPRLIIGLTGPKLLENKKHSEFLHSWPRRAHDTLTFLTNILTFSPRAEITSSSETLPSETTISTPPDSESCTHDGNTSSVMKHFSTLTLPGRRGQVVIEIVEINDQFGPTITEEEIEALVVSEETKEGGVKVNERRREKGWKDLDVFVVGVVADEEGGEGKMSSTEIRRRRGGRGWGRI